MSLLFRIVYAAHANGTHHKLALDALEHLRVPEAEAWRKVFLANVAAYLEGSKAPDTQFKDFKNHVLHVGDDYWGGAPEMALAWYQNTISALRARSWHEVAFAAGVLSHYVTDPIHPFHTAQSEAESNIHRAVEWSINRAYDGLKAEGERDNPRLSVSLPRDEPWLKALVIAGAEVSNAEYHRLIAHYDFERGVVDPPAGLDPTARALVARLIVYASRSFALVLDRAIAEARVVPPQIDLTSETVLAALKIPAKWVEKRLANAEDRRLVSTMYDELKATGRVDATLPEDDRTVRDLHAREIAAPRLAQRQEARARRLRAAAAPAAAARREPRALTSIPPAAAAGATLSQRLADAAAAPAREIAPAAPAEPEPGPRRSLAALNRPQATATAARTAPPDLVRSPRCHLAPADDIEAAPGIGAKTAARLKDAGVASVAELLAADGATLAKTIGARHIAARTIAAWQEQARLVMSVPGLRGTHAQILHGAGCTDAAALASADPAALSAAVLRFAGTREGERLLRDGAAPDIEKLKGWVEAARQVLAA